MDLIFPPPLLNLLSWYILMVITLLTIEVLFTYIFDYDLFTIVHGCIHFINVIIIIHTKNTFFFKIIIIIRSAHNFIALFVDVIFSTIVINATAILINFFYIVLNFILIFFVSLS